MLRTETDSDKKFYLLLGIITLAGFFTRIHGLGSESITGDEASSLLQAKFPSFQAMIDGGVRPDVHPAFLESLLYFWTKWFGNDLFFTRLPFAIFGTASVWLSGVIGRKWFSNTTGLATAIGMAFLQFPLIYSQLMRPYAPGLFFTLLAVYFWSKFIVEKSARPRDIIGFAVAAALTAYSHYFSLMTIALIAMTGIFFVTKELRWKYILACALAALLFVPHLSITLSQMKMGGVGGPNGWLSKPTPSFFRDHLQFAFDDSRGLMWGVLLTCCLSALVFFRKPKKLQLFAILFWMLPLLIGYVYSVEKNPVLQNSGLLFAFPFLLMFLFSRFPDYQVRKIALIFPAGFALIFFGYIAFYKPYHLTDHFGRLKELVEITNEIQDKYSSNRVDVYFNVDAPYYLEYNSQQLGKSPKNVLGTITNGRKDLTEFRNIVENSNADYFVYGWSTRYSPLEILPIIREKFPHLVERKEWFNSAIYVFSRFENSENVDETKGRIFESQKYFDEDGINSENEYDSLKFQKATANWSQTCKVQIADTSIHDIPSDIVNGHLVPHVNPGHNYEIRLDSTCVYSPLLKKKVGDIVKNPDNTILFTAHMQMLDTNSKVILVIEFIRDGKQLYWNGMESSDQIDPDDWRKWQNVYFGLQLPNELRLTDTVNFYCYSVNGLPAIIDFLDVKTLKGHSGIYGPRPDFQ